MSSLQVEARIVRPYFCPNENLNAPDAAAPPALPLSPGRNAPRLKLPGARPPLLPELCSGQENLGNLGAAGPLAAPSGVAWPYEGSAAAAVVPSAVNDCLKGTPDWAAAASGVGGIVAADPEPDDPEAKKLEAAAEGAADSALVGVMTGAAKGAAGAKPVEGAAAGSAAGSAAEAGAVLLLSALGALEAELNVHPSVPKGAAADCLPWALGVAVPREAAHSGDPKPGTLAAPPATAEAKDQPGVPNAGALPVSGGRVGDQSATVGDLRVLLPVPAAAACAAFGAEGGGPAAASATAGPPLLVLEGMGVEKLPKAPG